MKLFLDQNKTLLPRIDVIFVLTRLMLLLGLGWFILFGKYPQEDSLMLYIFTGTFAIHLALFFSVMKSNRDLKLAYLSAIIFDIFFIPMYVYQTGAYDSSLYLMFYLTISVAVYVLSFWLAAAVASIMTIAYIGLLLPALTLDNIFGLVNRIGFLWVYFFAIAYASEHMRRSEGRLMKLFDTLNMRTSELEKSQAQLEMIYENTRILASILKPDMVVREIMRIMDSTLQYETDAVIFKNKTGEFYYEARSSKGKSSTNPKAIAREDAELITKVSELHEPIHINDIRKRDNYKPLTESSRSVIIVPLTSYGQTRGILIAESDEVGFFSEKDVKMLSVVARSAALALENAELHQRMEELTMTDELTDTFNYRYFVRKLEEEKKRAQRYDLALSIVMIDIDWFKKLNDTFGHETGNNVLRRLSLAIKGCIRDVDIFARYGGEEFAIILPQTPLIEARQIGERIREQVEAMVTEVDDGAKVKITVSVGISSFPENGKSQEELLSIADQALYRAKGSGKNIVCVV